jgi:L-2-hydroxyglutarate oxidase
LPNFKFGIVGGGIVGLSLAHKLAKKYPDCHIELFEKESKLAEHQTGRNSGVIHSGIYYKPGSLKATTCQTGKAQLEDFCNEHGVKWEACGKVIVAVDDSEIPALERIYARGQENQVPCSLLSKEELAEIEPAANGVRAIRVPVTGIVDYVGFCSELARQLLEKGHRIHLDAAVTGITSTEASARIKSMGSDHEFDFIITCAGLHSDRLAKLAGLHPKLKIVPFRGEYFELTPDAEHLCKHLIYPVPDPAFPFLGVHFTRMVLGGVECGPNAVLAFAREGYSKSTVNLKDLTESMTYGGFVKLATKHWKMGLGEMHRSISKAAFVKALQRLVPAIESRHLHAAPAGVRAQAIAPNGMPVDDFAFEENARTIHVINAVSPAATASLSIADHIIAKLDERLR